MNDEELIAFMRKGGATDTEINQALAQRHAPVQQAAPPMAPAPQPTTSQQVGSGWAGGLERALGAINPFQDELTGAVNALPSLLTGHLKQGAETYQRERDASRERQAAFAQANPITSKALGAAGMILPAFASGGASLAAQGGVGLSRLEAFGQGAKAALPWAAGVSFGNAEGTPAEQAVQTAFGTGLGTALGGGAGVAGNWIANRLGSRAGATPDMAREFKFQGVSPGEAATKTITNPDIAANAPAAVRAGQPMAGALRASMRSDPTLARSAEKQISTLRRLKNDVGDQMQAYVLTPTAPGQSAPEFAPDHPLSQLILDNVRKNGVFAQRVRQAAENVAERGRPVGPVGTEARTVREALAGGVPMADVIAALPSNPMQYTVKSFALAIKNNPAALDLPVTGLKITETKPYTLEFVRELTHLSNRQTKSAVAKAVTNDKGSVLPETEANNLVRSIKDLSEEAHPQYGALSRQYGEAAQAQQTLQKMTGAAKGPDGNYHITTGAEMDPGLSLVEARALAGTVVPGTSPRYAAESGLMSLLRGESKAATAERARAIGKGLLSTGNAGQEWLQQVARIGPNTAASRAGQVTGIGAGHAIPSLWNLFANGQ